MSSIFDPLIIAGPCALESKEQLRLCIQALCGYGIKHIRASLWKPRTRPGWQGLGTAGLPMLLEESWKAGMTPATEVLTKEHAEAVVQALRKKNEGEMILWLGARNQNHMIQKAIARVLSPLSDRITLIFKNQMWDDETHWLGIFEHLLSAGFPKERLMTCHRGFAPGKMENPWCLRNLPDFSMAMRVKEALGIPMLLDPSHIGGKREKVKQVLRDSLDYPFDGYLIEVHSAPEAALTDKQQQMSLAEIPMLLPVESL